MANYGAGGEVELKMRRVVTNPAMDPPCSVAADASSVPAGVMVIDSIADRIQSRIREDIFYENIPAGTRLIETAIGEQYGVSRGPVRAALVALEDRGLVIRSARRETRVVQLTASDVHEVYDFRVALELFALQEMRRRDGLVLTPLSDALSSLATTLTESYSAVDRAIADVGFHKVLLTLAHNRYLSRAWDTLEDRLILIVSRIQRFKMEDRDLVLQIHSDILDAVKLEDWACADASVRKHATTALNALSSQVGV